MQGFSDFVKLLEEDSKKYTATANQHLVTITSEDVVLEITEDGFEYKYPTGESRPNLLKDGELLETFLLEGAKVLRKKVSKAFISTVVENIDNDALKTKILTMCLSKDVSCETLVTSLEAKTDNQAFSVSMLENRKNATAFGLAFWVVKS